VLDTTKGKITVDLYTEQAPLAVNNFIFLATQGWFDGIPFYKVVPGFIVQSGDPSGSGMGNPGYQFVNEKHDLKFGDPGVVGMANSGKDKNGSQFFITFNLHDYYQQSIKEANDKLTSENKLTDEMIEKEVQDQLNKMSDSYTVFGKVSEGYDVAQTLTTSDSILSVTIEEKAK
jgi:cyclophilin family peptidyl-prolyl cis-trans isomerase